MATYLEITDIKEPIINNNILYYSFTDIKNACNNDTYYTKIIKLFDAVDSYNNLAFFKIYNIIDDIILWKQLYTEIVSNKEELMVNNAINGINSIVLNPAVESFLKYNSLFRWTSYQIGNIMNENYSTFRISNEHITQSNSAILKSLSITKDKKVIELDVKGSDWFFISFMNYLYKKNQQSFDKIKNDGIYSLISSTQEHSAHKLNILASMYSITCNSAINATQAEIIKAFDVFEFIEYMTENESIQLPNGFYRTNKHNIALYGQTLTSMFVMRFIYISLYKFINDLGGTIITSKHDSIIFMIDSDVEFDRYAFNVRLYNAVINFCGIDITLGHNEEVIFNDYFRTNYKLTQLNTFDTQQGHNE